MKYKPGQRVQLKELDSIFATLDEEGKRDGLHFMRELWEAGRESELVVDKIVEQFTFDGASRCRGESPVRKFKGEPVALLKDFRCSGKYHGGCDRNCNLFVKESWLQEPKGIAAISGANNEESASKLETLGSKDSSGNYVCQSSELYHATKPLNRLQRILNLLKNTVNGNYRIRETIRNVGTWIGYECRKTVTGEYPRGEQKRTPDQALNLQPGEIAEVKPLEEIIKTLNSKGYNRGLHFTFEMIRFCGKRMRVRERVERIIAEGTGQMRPMRNTVFLEGAYCDSSSWAFGGCPRGDPIYWREIWLKRVNE